MTTTNRPPLWEVMAQARYESDGAFYRSVGLATAAEIRAVAEWIEKCQVEDYGRVLSDVRDVIEWLTAEADRAERGEVQP